MATLPREAIDAYTARLRSLSDAARRMVAEALYRVEYEDVADLRDKAIEAMEAVCGASSEMAAALAAEFYDEVRELALGEALGADADPARDPGRTEGAVRAIVQDVVDGKPWEGFVAKLADRASYEVMRAAGECVRANAARDPSSERWARVPSGSETCRFCLMLASRGFAYSSAEAAGSDGHYHPNCDCRIVPGFDGMEVEGYDPDELYRQWLDSDHPEAMRRYAERKRERRERGELPSESRFAYDGGVDGPVFRSFKDVQGYLGGADDERELERRHGVLASIYGPDSEQMTSGAVENAMRHMRWRFRDRRRGH